MIVIDSSVWIEFLTGGRRAGQVEKYFRGAKIILPAIVIFEVYRKIKVERGEREAIFDVANMERLADSIVSIDHPLAIFAADLAIAHKLPTADALIYAVVRSTGAKIVTLDRHFKNLELAEVVG